MRRSTLGAAGTLAAGLAAVSLAFAPTASAAVSPGSVTASYDCGSWGGGPATLTMTHSGTTAQVWIDSPVTSPISVGADTISSTLILDNTTGPDRVFTGKKNPAIPAGGAAKLGPLTATNVVAGDRLNSYFAGVALKLVIFGVTVNCDAVTSQSPGPFVIS
ncbi:hypothetical protein ACFFTQ_08200 [Streptomyces roseofulvus]|uniref:hypothetical protein n=1 Tax=Streptomyces roseofulvus TaxID=33902 RepID=UPI0031F78F1B